MKPCRLSELLTTCDSAQKTSYFLGDFLDLFYSNPSPEWIVNPPALLKDRFPQGKIWDAYWGAVAEFISHKYQFPTPNLVEAPERFLKNRIWELKPPPFGAHFFWRAPSSPVEETSRDRKCAQSGQKAEIKAEIYMDLKADEFRLLTR